MPAVHATPTSADDTATERPTITPRQIVQAEANLLRFPFFALHTKGLKNRRAIEVLGTRKDDEGTRHDFSLRVSRNTDYCYPGPLSRKLHFALLGMLFQQGSHPFENPITWDWRDLNRRTGDQWCGGRTIENYKDAIARTHGVVITTNYALMHKGESGKQPLPRRTKGYHLYERYEFVSELADDGGVADGNRLWLADWYLANLNAFYSGPLKYDLWMELNNESAIASRLYEYLLYHSRLPKLQINYRSLASFLPVAPMLYLAQARRQLDPPLQLLQLHDVVNGFEWGTARDGQIQLIIHPGPSLRRDHGKTAAPSGVVPLDEFDSLRVVEVADNQTPEADLVRRYHALRFGNDNHRPTRAELAFAASILAAHESSLVMDVLPELADVMKELWPDGRTFGAARPYFSDLIDAHVREQEQAAKRRLEQEQTARDEQQSRAAKAARIERNQRLFEQWHNLPPTEQERLAQRAIDNASSQFDRKRLHARLADLSDPPTEYLRQLEQHLSAKHRSA